MDEVLTVRDVAVRLKLAERTVHAMAAAGELPAFKIRGQWRLRRSEFEAWLDRMSGAAPQASAAIDVQPAPALAPVALATPVATATPVTQLTERVTLEVMQQRFVTALGPAARTHSAVGTKPLELDLAPPLPSQVRVYMYNATRPPGGRPLGEHKVQLMVPGQARNERGSFDDSDRTVLLVGYAAEEDVFVFWDAGLYANFAWSRNVQVKAQTIIEASAGRLAFQHRQLRPAGGSAVLETLVAAPPALLAEAIERRVQLTRDRMIAD